jgi:hypothetical protein
MWVVFRDVVLVRVRVTHVQDRGVVVPSSIIAEPRTPDPLWRIGLSSVVETLRLTTSGHGPLMAV